MNKWIGMGRLTRNPEVRYSSGDSPVAVARYTLAIDSRYKRESEQGADFISCLCFGKSAEFAEKYLCKGTKMIVSGRIQTGNYTNKEGQKVYTTEVVVEEQEFAESKTASEGRGQSSGQAQQSAPKPGDSDFMDIPPEIEEELPFQ